MKRTLSGASKKLTARAIARVPRVATGSSSDSTARLLSIGERVALMKKHGVGSIQITVAKTIGELKIGRIYPEAVEVD